MTNQEAAQILRDHNKWRRDQSGHINIPHSGQKLGQAIDTAVKTLEQPEPDELERFKADLLRLFPFSDGANWMAVDSDGELCQFEKRPTAGMSYWGDRSENFVQALAVIKLPDNIDWRDCLIDRH